MHIIIPARYASTRLPGKPLIPINGIPMVIQTWKRCIEATQEGRVYIATDDRRIYNTCRQFGAKCIMTSDSCLTGTDRVAEAAGKLPGDAFLNVQGDEPLFNPDDITRMIEAYSKAPDCVLNGYTDITASNDYFSASIPKLTMRQDGRLLYMSRSPIPGNKAQTFRYGYRQICAYVFPRQSLIEYAQHGKKTPMEQEEDIEILRFLELGHDVRMVKLSERSLAVDCPEDVDRADNAARMLGLT